MLIPQLHVNGQIYKAAKTLVKFIHLAKAMIRKYLDIFAIMVNALSLILSNTM